MKTVQQPILPPEQNGAPNPNATIGFVIFYPFHYYIHKNIYRQIVNQSEFIVDMNAFFPVEQSSELLDEIIALLKKEGAHYRILEFGDICHKRYMRRFFMKYQALVGVWERGCLNHEETSEIKKVNVTYGAGKELTFVRPSQGLYDLTLDYGKRSSMLHSYFTNSVITGNAKFDDWFNDTVDPVTITDLRSKIDPRKKTLLYLPTHSDLSSIDILADELGILNCSYNILTKLHYFTSREELERIKLLKSKGLILYGDDTDILPLLKVSDIVLSDNSSAIFDAILADKPVIVADFWNEKFLDEEYAVRKKNRLNIANILTFSGSIEQRIKKDGSVITVNNTVELRKKIEEGLLDSLHFKKRRSELRNEIFSFNDGRCAERGAKAIINLIEHQGTSGRPILYYAIEAFKKSHYLYSGSEKKYFSEKSADRDLTAQTGLIKNEFRESFSVIFLLKKSGSVERMASLQSIIEQDFSFDKYEIIIIADADNSIRTPLQRKDDLDGSPSIKIIRDKIDHMYSAGISDAIAMSTGSIICLTDSDHIVPDDWLLSLSATYSEQPGIVGCGGFVQAKENTLFDYFSYYEISKKIGLGNEIYPFNLKKMFSVTNNLILLNPMGTLANSSYRKDCLSDLILENTDEIETGLALKYEATKKGELCFRPNYVTKISKTTFKNFLAENIRFGYSLSLWQESLPSATREMSRNTFVRIFTDSIGQYALLFSWINFLVSLVIFLAYSGQWIGRISALAYMRIEKIRSKIEDELKSLSH